MATLFSGLFCAGKRVKTPKPETVMGDVSPKQPVSGSSTLSSTGTDTTRRSLLLGGAADTRTGSTSSESSKLSDNTDHTNTSPRRSSSSLSVLSVDSTSSTFSQLSDDADHINARSRSKVSTAGKALEKRTTDALAVLTKISEEARTTADFIPVVEALKTLANHYATHSSDKVPIQLLENLGNIPNPLAYNGTLRNLFLATLKDALLEAKHVDPSRNIRDKFYDITGLRKGFSKIDATDDCRNFLADAAHAKAIGIQLTVENRGIISDHRQACEDLNHTLKTQDPGRAHKKIEALARVSVITPQQNIRYLGIPKETEQSLKDAGLLETFKLYRKNVAHAYQYGLDPRLSLSQTVNSHREHVQKLEQLLKTPPTETTIRELWDAVHKLHEASTIIFKNQETMVIPFPEHITLALSKIGISRETCVQFYNRFGNTELELTLRVELLKQANVPQKALDVNQLAGLLLLYASRPLNEPLPPLSSTIMERLDEQQLKEGAINFLDSNLKDKNPGITDFSKRITEIFGR